MLQIISSNISTDFFENATIYSYLNDCSPSCQFCTELNILQNCRHAIKDDNFKLISITATQMIAHYSVNFDLIHKFLKLLAF